MHSGRRWRIAAVTAILLSLLSPFAQPAHAQTQATTASLSDLKSQLVYFTKASQTTDRALTLNAISAKSAFEGKLWRNFLTAWDSATTAQKLNFVPPSGLPGTGHVFVVLGGSLNANGTLKAQTINRLKVARSALAAYPHSGVLVSGGAPRHGVTEAQAMRAWLLANGIAAGRITTETKSSSTVGNAKYSIAVLATKPAITSYTLISDASHLRRAGVLFDAAMLQTEEKNGREWNLSRIANVAYRDKTIINPASDATTTVIASEVAGLLGLSGYGDLVRKPPAKAKLTSLAVKPPSATTYQVGARLKTSGLQATAVFDNGIRSLVVTDKVSLTTYNASKVGTGKVTASYTANAVTKTASFPVTVTRASASVSLKLSTTNVKKSRTRATVKAKVTSATGISTSGTVALYSGRAKLKTVTLKNGAAEYKLPTFASTGTKTITVKYSGSATVTSAQATAKLKVRK